MGNVAENEFCYGCGVCVISCPHKAIGLNYNAEGFYRPQIDNSICVNCGICTNICSYNKEDVLENADSFLKSYSSWSRNNEVRDKCSSGGIAFEISKQALKKGYNICAVKYDIHRGKAMHYIADSEDSLKESIGSKYLQSYSVTGLENIDFNKKNLVVGTPCMIDSFRRLIRRKHVENNFVLVDFFCHGVPSYLLWKKYIKIKKSKNGELKSVLWRDSSLGWHNSLRMKIEGERGVYEGGISDGDIFYRLFLQDYCLGKACYEKCKFKMEHSSADLRIGDLWGPTYQSNKNGVSGLLVLSSCGEKIISEMSDIYLKEEKFNVVVEGQMLDSPRMPYLRRPLLKLLSLNNNNMCIEEVLINIDSVLKKITKFITKPGEVISNRLIRYKDEAKSRNNNNA